MAAPLVDPLLAKFQQTTSTLKKASRILRTTFLTEGQNDKSLAVQLPRRDVPTYVLPNQGVQPWELLPMKAAAMAQYPNFFNNSCTFFGSIKRDIVNGVPFCLVRTSRLAIDLAKVVRNLGIVDGFENVQRRQRLGPHDFVWTPDQPEPNDIYDVALFKYRLLRLHLRTDMYSLLPNPASQSAAPLPPLPPAAQLAPALGLLPLSVKNISKASRPVLMYPRQLETARAGLPSGIFFCFHPELGITTDAVAELYDVPVLVAAHVGLPLSQVVQIRGALRLKAKEESGVPLRQLVPLRSWNMVEVLRRRVAERQQALQAATVSPQLEGGQQALQAAGGEGAEPLLESQMRELREKAKEENTRLSSQVSDALRGAQSLEDGLLAWQVLRSGAVRGSTGGRPGGDDRREEGGGGGRRSGGGGGGYGEGRGERGGRRGDGTGREV